MATTLLQLKHILVLNFVVNAFINMLLVQPTEAAFAASNDQIATSKGKESAVPYDTVIKYLMNFDYLPKSDLETGALRTEEQYTTAIEKLQRFGNIPVTGKVDAATIKLMKTPRCGLGDNSYASDFSDNLLHNRRKKRYVLQGEKWQKNEITWSLANTTIRNRDYVRRALSDALTIWQNHSLLNFREVYDPKADIQVMFVRKNHGDGNNFDGPGNVLAHAFYPGPDRGGDAHFDSDETWLVMGETREQGTNLFDVAVHEFGHSLGLGHSATIGAIMFPWYMGYNLNGKLPDDDRLAIQELYGSRTKTWGPKISRMPPRRISTTRPTTTTTTTTTTTRRPFAVSKKPHSRIHYVQRTLPNRCATPYDAVSMIRSDLFIFRDQYHWRFTADGKLVNEIPNKTRYFWKRLPEDFKRIDAVYETNQQDIVFFIGKRYYMFSGTTLISGYPKNLTELGLPEYLDHIDAAFVWGHNKATFLLSGHLYWRLDDYTGKVEPDYPRDIAGAWKGAGYHIDAAFQYKNGKTYFFKDLHFWEFNDDLMQVSNHKARPSAQYWMKCPPPIPISNEKQIATTPTSSSSILKSFSYRCLILTILITVIFH